MYDSVTELKKQLNQVEEMAADPKYSIYKYEEPYLRTSEERDAYHKKLRRNTYIVIAAGIILSAVLFVLFY